MVRGKLLECVLRNPKDEPVNRLKDGKRAIELPSIAFDCNRTAAVLLAWFYWLESIGLGLLAC